MEDTKKTKNTLAEAAAEAAFVNMLLGIKPSQPKPAEDSARVLHTEALVDFDHVSIPTVRFEDLVRAEEKLGIVFRAHQIMESYQLHAALDLVFGPKEEKGDAQ